MARIARSSSCLWLALLLAAPLCGQNTVTLTASNLQNAFGAKLAAGQACFQGVSNAGAPTGFRAGGGG